MTTTDDVLWKDLIEIPDASDTFVLNMTAGLDERAQTVRDYVVTESLAGCYEQALDLIRDGLAVGRPGKPDSKGAFLHGSFGSGKSHFMAILNLVLQGYPAARDLEKIRGLVAGHSWMDDVDLLMLPFHMLDENSMEAAILGGYVEFVMENHPEAPIPAVYPATEILEDAENLRSRMSDEAFFEGLNEASGEASGWDKVVGTRWDADSYQAAVDAPPESKERRQLIGDLVDAYFRSQQKTAKEAAGGVGFVSIDEGLSIVSQHAASLGYDGLILFLDELILWLARRAANPEFVSREVQKISKLVEFEHTERPAPLFSFIARQRDLSEMIGTDGMGSGQATAQLALQQESLKGRMHLIELDDSDLPTIAAARLLRPKDGEAQRLIDEGFDRKLQSLTDEERDIMVTSKHDPEAFRKVFPFSPALVEALIVYSNELQRKRTALRIMQLLLMRKGPRLKMGELIAVGDLWNILREGEEPMDSVERKRFRKAKQIDDHGLRPVLMRHHDIDDVSELDPDDPSDARKLDAYHDDLRLLHTLLIAALVPYLEVFENMTPQRLVALNHGSVQAFIPEAAPDEAMRKLQKLATEIPELHLTDPPNATAEIRLKGVDIEPIIQQANTHDGIGQRAYKVQQMLFGMMDIKETGERRGRLDIDWKGSKRRIEVVFGNVRDQQSLSWFRCSNDADWKLVLDYPFDEEGYDTESDLEKLDEFRRAVPAGTHTIIWLPKFLSHAGRQLLGRLVKISAVLNSFRSYTKAYSQKDRELARQQLESDRDALKKRLRPAIRSAYGLSKEEPQLLSEESHTDFLHTLAPNYAPRMPQLGSSFEQALIQIAKHGLDARYPNAYPLPNRTLTPRAVQAMHETIRRAIDSPEGMASAERSERDNLRDFAAALDLGVMGPNRFERKRTWALEMVEQLGAFDGPVDVGELYEVIDPDDEPTGLPRHLQDLIVLAVADMEDLVILRNGEPVAAGPGDLKATDVLEPRDMPDGKTWDVARAVGRQVFGLRRTPETLSARNVERLAANIRDKAEPNAEEARQLAESLIMAGRHLGMEASEVRSTRRYTLAQALGELVAAVDHTDPTDMLEAIAAVDLATEDYSVVSLSFERAPQNLNLLDHIQWTLFDHLVEREKEQGRGAVSLLEDARQTLSNPEQSMKLQKLEAVQQQLIEEVTRKQTPPKPVSPTPGTDDDEEPDETTPGRQQVERFEAPPRAAVDKLQSWIESTFSDGGEGNIVITVEYEEQ